MSATHVMLDSGCVPTERTELVTIQAFWQAIANDTMLQAMLVLVVVDLLLGVTAAVKQTDFSFAKLALFARDDLLGKLVPWAVLYGAWKFAPSASVLGVDFEVITRGAGAIVVAALAGSLTSSLAELGVALPNPLRSGENDTQ